MTDTLSNARNKVNITLDMYEQLKSAILSEDLEALSGLIESGIDVDLVDLNGETPLLMAIRANKLITADYLIQIGADIDKRDNNAVTPLMELCRNNISSDIFKRVVSTSKQVNSRNNLGETALHMAAYGGYLQLVKMLVDNGADVNIENRKGESPLHKTATYGWTEVAAYLVGQGSDIKKTDIAGNNIKHLANLYGFKSLVEYIESISVDLDTRNNEGKIPTQCSSPILEYDLKKDGDTLIKQAKEYVLNYEETRKGIV